MTSPAARLRAHLTDTPLTVMPCCFDGLSAKLIGDAGFPVTFMSGFAVSAARLGAPDTGLISYGEMVDQGRNVCAATPSLVIGDGDTGYGNALNVKRTVKGYAQAGFAAIMIEDQLAPKRCGHTRGKLVVDRVQAVDRIKAAVDAREDGADILILARTDARHGHGLDEALERARLFREAGADLLFVEAPQSVEEMETVCREVPGIHMANLVEGGATPMLSHAELEQIGYRLAAYPLTLLSAATKAMVSALQVMAAGEHPGSALLDFAELRRHVGFDAYYAEEEAYADKRS
ncbi:MULTISPECIES: isocitrate lyase/PEP mutase family protein [Stappia]|uniref:Isocitrate lyase/PEP mutase family protein n=1 Tax=Stappia taiwanensis TaxID=992267 RepID=A0A838XZ92_9HYPH|nr:MULTISPECIES: isocitrate lyase/PEP mutase family protein [Stappia]MBA4612070.1 isocitrate lyase/PEP mutase family protein [Stappia taiwanensis]MCA1297707.1 isocitrate lyase/PEP mutase family protein [Stappia indica]GGE91322.1 carboxyvinyl-carboxyphosphonate phosphorylmutase [Stappia taiwanensis]